MSVVADFGAVVALIVGVGIFLLATFTGLPEGLRILVSLAAGLVVGGTAGALVAHKAAKRAPEDGYRWIALNQTYEFNEANPRLQRLISRITIQSTRSNVFMFVNRTQWTGAIEPRYAVLSADHSLFVSPKGFEGWRQYVVIFDRPLAKNETAEIVVRSHYVDISTDSSHWVGWTPDGPIRDGLALNISMGLNSPGADRYEASVMWPGRGRNAVISTSAPDRDSLTGEASAHFPKPRSGRRYQLQVEYEYPSDGSELSSVTEPGWPAPPDATA